MSLTTDPENPCLRVIRADGMQECYLVLSEEERAKGFVRPVRTSYKHTPQKPKYPLRDLTDEEKTRYAGRAYVKYEVYPEAESSVIGRFWTQQQLEKQCGAVTTMGLALAETYARDPKFYGGTFCCACGAHFPVQEFEWTDDGTPVGS